MKRFVPVLALAVFVAASSASLARAHEQPPLIKHVPVANANEGDKRCERVKMALAKEAKSCPDESAAMAGVDCKDKVQRKAAGVLTLDTICREKVKAGAKAAASKAKEALSSGDQHRDVVECTRLEAKPPDFALGGLLLHPTLPTYELKVVVDATPRQGVARLEIRSTGGSEVAQAIGEADKLDAMLLNGTYPVLQCDVNFDGFQDLLVFSMPGAPANEWFQFLMFDPSTKRFHFNATAVVNPTLDIKKREVVGWGGSGCCWQTATRIKVEKTRVRVLSTKTSPLRP